ncbi:hypothetical protein CAUPRSCDRAFT_12082 [Caulochytrium protostelioides]|nr:hypothetical protein CAUPRSCDRAFT_12082 [Caulochytrium protostelioides]
MSPAAATLTSAEAVTRDGEGSSEASFLSMLGHGVIRGFAWIFKMIASIGSRLVFLIEKRRDVFNWQDITLTADFMTYYLTKLGDLGYHGIGLVRKGSHEAFDGWEQKIDDNAERLISHFGGSDLTARELLKHQKKLARQHGPHSTGDPRSAASIKTPYQAAGEDADAKTLYVADRWLNNFNSVQVSTDGPDHMSKFRSFVDRLQAIALDMLQELKQALTTDHYEEFKLHVLSFTEAASFMDRTLARIINFLRFMLQRGLELIKHVFSVLLNFASVYWTVCMGILRMPLAPSFLTKFWSKTIGGGNLQFTFLDHLALYGSFFATAQHKTYNNLEAPFTKKDMMAIRSSPSHELILYTWNTHPSTSSRGDKVLEHHRLGIYAWIPRQALLAVAATQNMAFNLPLILYDGTTSNPGRATYIPMVINNMVNVLHRVASYPLTQLTTNDPAAVGKSLDNPNPLFFGFWASSVYQNMFGMIRPILASQVPGFEQLASAPTYGIINLWMAWIPWTIYRIPIQFATGKDIAPHDTYRQIVYQFGWIDILNHMISPLLPFIKRPQGSMNDGQYSIAAKKFERSKTWFLVSFDLFMVFTMQLRATLMSKHHIVGMLSSSWQPSEAEREEFKRQSAAV